MSNYHIFSGEYSWYTFDIVSNLPDDFNAKTDLDSPTRKVLNYLAALPIEKGRLQYEEKIFEKIGSVFNPSEIGVITTYELNLPVDPQIDNYIWNSQFDVPYCNLPEYWQISGEAYLSDDSALGKHSCFVSSDSSIEQEVLLPNYGGTWYVGLNSKADAPFTVETTWTGGSYTKTVASTGSWRRVVWQITIPDTINKLTIKINGECLCDKIFISHLNEWTHSIKDKPWFIDDYEMPILYYGVSGDKTERIFEFFPEENTLEGWPLYCSSSVTTKKRRYQTINISGDTEVALTVSPRYRTLTALSDYLTSTYGQDFIVSATYDGTFYNSNDNDSILIDSTRAIYISSDPITISIPGLEIPLIREIYLYSSDKINFYDYRFDTVEDWLDHYGCEYSGDATGTINTIADLSNLHGSVVLCNLPTENNEPIFTNNLFGFIVAEFGTRHDLYWYYSGEDISAKTLELQEYLVENAKLAKHHHYDYDTDKHIFEEISGYTIKDMTIDRRGTLYILTDDPYIYISDMSLIHPNQKWIPIISKLDPNISFSFSGDFLFGKYIHSKALHLENKDNAYRIDLIYPYGLWSEDGIFFSRIEYTNITVVANDNANSK